MPGTRVGVVVVLVLATLLVACGARNELVYSASGSAAEAEVVYLDGEGNEQRAVVALPWRMELRGGNDIEYALTVTRSAGAPGTVACEVVINEQRMGQAEAQVLAECAGTFRRQGGTTTGRGTTRTDPPRLVMTVVAEEIEAALRDGVPDVASVWALTPYTHEADCIGVDRNLRKRGFSLDVPEGLSTETCYAGEEGVSGYVVFRDDPDAPTIVVELPWLQHRDDVAAAVAEGWELLAERAEARERAGVALRVNEEGRLEHRGSEVPFLDTVGYDAAARRPVVSRLALFPGRDGHGLGLLLEVVLEGDAVHGYAAFDALSRAMIDSLVVDVAQTQVLGLTLTNDLDGGTPRSGFAVGSGLFVPEGTEDLHLALDVRDFLPEIVLEQRWYRGDDLLFEETLAWGDRPADGWVALPVPLDQLPLGHYRVRLDVLGAAARDVFAYLWSSEQAIGFEPHEFETPFVVGEPAWVYQDRMLDSFHRGDVERALATGERAILLYPDDHETLGTFADVLRSAGRPSEAIPLLERATEVRPTYDFGHLLLAVILEADDPAAAIERYGAVIEVGVAWSGLSRSRAQEIQENMAIAHRRRGILHYAAGDLEAASADLLRAYELNEADTQSLFNHAIVALELERFDVAIESLDRLLLVDPGATWWRFQRGFTYESMGAAALARSDFERVLELTDDPDLRARAEAGLARLGE